MDCGVSQIPESSVTRRCCGAPLPHFVPYTELPSKLQQVSTDARAVICFPTASIHQCTMTLARSAGSSAFLLTSSAQWGRDPGGASPRSNNDTRYPCDPFSGCI
ncbi:butyrophilin subfamily 2 member A1-like [Platysternon megacephalum]|uniref:Butyrophilin subfamily 2 member A1-like n=1 Tax=Platysternon megacephalum TaxID=55544 RepID=A0A4D9E4H8_9SAUR|nr:butyrophilin subfamily 2 member A1-like [Platysternon megacephalum]